MTLEAVAGGDFTRAFLSQVELGRARPSTRTLQIIAERLHKPIEYFLLDADLSSAAIELTLTESQTRLLQGDLKRARALLEQLLSRPVPLEVKTRAQLVLAEVELKSGRVPAALDLLLPALTTAETSGFHAIVAEICDRIGSAHYLARRRGEAARWFDRALDAFEASGLTDPTLKARILGHRANIHYVSGEPQEAIAAYQSAIEAAEHILDMPGLAGIYEGLAVAFGQTGQLSRALEYAQRSLRLFETLQDVRMSAQLRNNMADMLLQQGRLEQAQRLFDEGASQLERVGDREMLPVLYAGAAEARLERHDLQGALAAVGRALDAASVSSDPLARVAAFRVQGRVAHAQRRPQDARAAFERALTLAQEVANPDLLARVSYDYARALTEQGDAAQAAARFRDAYEARLRPARA